MARSIHPPATVIKFDPSYVTGYALNEERSKDGELTAVLTLHLAGAHVVLEATPFHRPAVLNEGGPCAS